MPPLRLCFDDFDDFLDRAVQIVVDHHVIESPAAFGHVDFALGSAEPLGDFLGAVPAAGLQVDAVV